MNRAWIFFISYSPEVMIERSLCGSEAVMIALKNFKMYENS